ncbi:restriction endonuclease subunit S [Paenibacillus sp. M1]|uniref:Restriction endonuclease subunit S n=1 Tax=Paenibacillus haidiansis TaxID=1574488 RepID=A0ABU7VWC4_9BACL
MSDMKENVPKIRFPGFTVPWEQRKAKDLFTPIVEKGHEKLPVLSVTQEFGVVYRDEVGIDIKYDASTLRDYKVIHPGDFVISLRSFQGGFELSDKLGITSPAYTIFKPKETNEHDNLFWKTLFKTFKFIESLKTVTFGIRDGKSISFSEFGDLTLHFPSNKDEQAKIGSCFRNLDSLITLHQRKLNNVKNMKAGLLRKMFPKDGEDFPEVRFPGFTDAWEQRKFNSVFDPIPNNTLSRADLNYDDGKIKSVHYGDILIKYGAVTDCGKDVIPFITGAEVSDYQGQLLQDGDVLIADAAEDETVGKATEIAGITGIPVVSGLHTIACRPKVKMQPNYLGYYMNSPSYHQQLLPLMQGIKVLSISRTNLAKTIICYPTSAQEQSQIGKVFADIDQLITLHQRKLEHLQEQKKALLQQMFV